VKLLLYVTKCGPSPSLPSHGEQLLPLHCTTLKKENEDNFPERWLPDFTLSRGGFAQEKVSPKSVS